MSNEVGVSDTLTVWLHSPCGFFPDRVFWRKALGWFDLRRLASHGPWFVFSHLFGRNIAQVGHEISNFAGRKIVEQA
jgi:hypothetical protein